MSTSPTSTGDFLQALMQGLQQEKVNADAESLADMLWLATKVSSELSSPKEETAPEHKTATAEATPSPDVQQHPKSSTLPTVPLTVARPRRHRSASAARAQKDSPSVVTPAAPALKSPLALGRALRPLMRKVPSRTRLVFNEEATAVRMVEQPNGWIPVLEPDNERWLSLTLVIERSPTAGLWQDIIADFQRILARQGAFQDVRAWRLAISNSGQIQLFSKPHIPISQQQPRPPKELTDPGGRHLVLLVSDGLSSLWRSPALYQCLSGWAKVGPVAWLQLLPERLWQRSAVGSGALAQLSAWLPGVANVQLDAQLLSPLDEIETDSALKLPVITLQPEPMLQWANVVAGSGNARIAGVLFESFAELSGDVVELAESTELSLTAQERVNRFRATASPIARRLAVYLSLVPVSLPVVYLLQQTCLPDVNQVHIAEVFMGGLLVSSGALGSDRDSLKQQYYDFFQDENRNNVRAILNQGVPRSQVDDILNKVSEYITSKAGKTSRSFTAALVSQSRGEEGSEDPELLEFARITKEVLHRLGGSHRAWVESFEEIVVEDETIDSDEFPLQEFEFEAAKVSFAEIGREFVLQTQTLTVGWLEASPAEPELELFEFETATVQHRWGEIQKRSGQGSQFVESLSEAVALEMVAVPAGKFMMGSATDEPNSSDNERPVHLVAIEAFFMAKMPVTQAQWKAVAGLEQINRKLTLEPSRFKGADLPVETVSWYEAVEFCDRLSAYTGRVYRLPSEAQWEYACRARTQTAFAFGERLTQELANYDGNIGRTTVVGRYPANAFGLYDMHGNVWEWCLDNWHGSYEEAPEDGSAWLTSAESSAKVLRGGSWIFNLGSCRSASRDNLNPASHNYHSGFRVVCLP